MRPNRQDRPAVIRAVSESFDGDTFTLEHNSDSGRPRRRTETTILVAYVNRWCAYIRGWEAHELLFELRGRRPLYSHRMSAWHCQPHTAKEAIAVLRSRGRLVEVVEELHMLMADPRDLDGDLERAETLGLLW